MSESGSPNGSTETWLVDDRVVLLDQISVFLENRPGSLAAAAAALAEAGTNLRALSIAETERFGIARLIADDTEQALATLQQAGFTSRVSKVFGIQVPDRPGGLAHLLQVFDGEVNVEYMYADLKGVGSNSLLIMKLEPIDVAMEILADAGLY